MPTLAPDAHRRHAMAVVANSIAPLKVSPPPPPPAPPPQRPPEAEVNASAAGWQAGLGIQQATSLALTKLTKRLVTATHHHQQQQQQHHLHQQQQQQQQQQLPNAVKRQVQQQQQVNNQFGLNGPKLNPVYHKRHRTTFHPYQLGLLEEAFKQNNYPNPAYREALALKTNLDASRIQVWFQNRRAKHKKQVNNAMRCLTTSHMNSHHRIAGSDHHSGTHQHCQGIDSTSPSSFMVAAAAAVAHRATLEHSVATIQQQSNYQQHLEQQQQQQPQQQLQLQIQQHQQQQHQQLSQHDMRQHMALDLHLNSSSGSGSILHHQLATESSNDNNSLSDQSPIGDLSPVVSALNCFINDQQNHAAAAMAATVNGGCFGMDDASASHLFGSEKLECFNGGGSNNSAPKVADFQFRSHHQPLQQQQQQQQLQSVQQQQQLHLQQQQQQQQQQLSLPNQQQQQPQPLPQQLQPQYHQPDLILQQPLAPSQRQHANNNNKGPAHYATSYTGAYYKPSQLARSAALNCNPFGGY